MLIENINLSKELTGVERKNFYFSPSRAGGCGRAMYFEYNKMEKTNPINTHIFEDGRMHEELTISFLEKEGVKIDNRQKSINIKVPLTLTPKYCGVCKKTIPPSTLHGHIDGIFHKTIDNKKIKGLFECKSVKNDTFKKYFYGGIYIGYLYQTALYLRGLNLEYCSIIVKNKDNATYFESIVHYDKKKDTLTLVEQKDTSNNCITFNMKINDITKSIINDFAYIEESLINNEIPQKRTEFCFNCSYKNLCDEVEQSNINNSSNSYTFDDLTDEAKERYANLILKYLTINQDKKIKEEKLNVIKEELLTFHRENNIKKLFINNFSIIFKTFEKTYVNFDKDKLYEKLGDEIENYITNQNNYKVEDIYIHHDHKQKIIDYLESLYKNKNKQKFLLKKP